MREESRCFESLDVLVSVVLPPYDFPLVQKISYIDYLGPGDCSLGLCNKRKIVEFRQIGEYNNPGPLCTRESEIRWEKEEVIGLLNVSCTSYPCLGVKILPKKTAEIPNHRVPNYTKELQSDGVSSFGLG